jgi:hypothetical protein
LAHVSRWFAERSDLILLLFDSYKLDISDEFKGIIENLKNYDDKVTYPYPPTLTLHLLVVSSLQVHCVMNKADQLDPESLMKVIPLPHLRPCFNHLLPPGLWCTPLVNGKNLSIS